MSSSDSHQFNEIIRQAEEALQESKDFFEKHGLDPDKARRYLESITTQEMRDQAKADFDADMAAIKHEVHQQMAYATTKSPGTLSGRRTSRKMI